MRKLLSSKVGRRAMRGLSAAAFVLALTVGQLAAAYPKAPPGYATVVVYYSNASGALIVGRLVVNSSCPPSTQPVTMVGTTSSVTSVGVYPCGQVPSPNIVVVD